MLRRKTSNHALPARTYMRSGGGMHRAAARHRLPSSFSPLPVHICRDLLLATNSEDFRSLAGVLEAVAELGKVVAVTSHAQAAAAVQERPGFFQSVRQVL